MQVYWLIPHIKHVHNCWWLGDGTNQSINSHGTDSSPGIFQVSAGRFVFLYKFFFYFVCTHVRLHVQWSYNTDWFYAELKSILSHIKHVIMRMAVPNVPLWHFTATTCLQYVWVKIRSRWDINCERKSLMEYVPKALCYIDGLCKEDVTPVRQQWSYVFLAQTHRYDIRASKHCWVVRLYSKFPFVFSRLCDKEITLIIYLLRNLWTFWLFTHWGGEKITAILQTLFLNCHF